MSFGVWISMRPFSTHTPRRACRKVVWMRKIRFCFGWRRSRKRQSMRLSRLESAAIGVSGLASVTTSSEATFTSRPPSFTRSSCLSSPDTLMNEPCESAEMVSVRARRAAFPELVEGAAATSTGSVSEGSSSRVAGFTNCTAPDSSRRMTNCTFFWSRTVSTHPDTVTGPSGSAARFLTRVRVFTIDHPTCGGFRAGRARAAAVTVPRGSRARRIQRERLSRLEAVPADQIHLVRHGEVFNPQGVLYGRLPGYGLSDLGRRMAQAAADDLAARDRLVRALVASPLQRTQQSAEPVSAAFGLPAVLDERVIEPENRFEGRRMRGRDGALRDVRSWPLLVNPWEPSWGEPFRSISTR